MIERSIRFAPDGRLVGTLCLPERADTAPAVGQILFNAGILHRVGPHRLNVRLARRLAGRGIPSLRFDLSGLGDSERAGTGLPYETQSVADLQAAMDALGQAAGVDRFALLGFCSGGRNGYGAATADERIAGIVLYDTYAYPTLRSRLTRYATLVRWNGFLASMRASLRHRWERVRGKAAASAGENPRRDPTRSEFVEWLRRLERRGVQVGVVHSGEGVNYNYRRQFADGLKGFGVAEHADVAFMPDMDHSAMALPMQAKFIDWLEDWMVTLDRRHRSP